MGDNRPPVYWEDDTLVIRASAIGSSCMFELIAAGQGYPPGLIPANLWRAFDEGNTLEPVVIQNLKSKGWNILSQQVEGELVVSENPRIVIRYHPDALAFPPTIDAVPIVLPRLTIVEVKALSEALYQKAAKTSVGEVIDEYAWQLSVMMWGEGEVTNQSGWNRTVPMPAAWVPCNKGLAPDKDTGVKPHCENEGRWFIERVDAPPISLSDITVKAMLIYEGVTGEDIVQSGRPCDDPSHWPCRYQSLRPEVESGVKVAGDGSKETRTVLRIGPEDQSEVDELVRQYLYLKGQADELKAQSERARDQLIERAGEHSRIVTERWDVPIVNGRGASRIEWDEVPAELKAQIKSYEKEGKSYRFIRGIKRRDD